MMGVMVNKVIPQPGVGGANSRDETKYCLLYELRFGPLAVFQMMNRADLNEKQVRACLRRNLLKKTPLVGLAGVVYDPLSERNIATWGLTQAGADWLNAHYVTEVGDDDE